MKYREFEINIPLEYIESINGKIVRHAISLGYEFVYKDGDYMNSPSLFFHESGKVTCNTVYLPFGFNSYKNTVQWYDFLRLKKSDLSIETQNVILYGGRLSGKSRMSNDSVDAIRYAIDHENLYPHQKYFIESNPTNRPSWIYKHFLDTTRMADLAEVLRQLNFDCPDWNSENRRNQIIATMTE